jgi:hypothetical protein
MAAIDLPRGWTWEGVLARLGEHVDLEQSARAHKAIARRRVIRSGAQLLRLVLAYVLSGLSLRGTVAWADAAGQASFSDVALLKRIRRAAPWLAELAGRLAVVASGPSGGLGDGFGGRRVVAIDATAICSPGGRDKRYRLLHTVYELGAQHFRTAEVSDRRVAERLDLGGVKAGEIRLGDRAYARHRDLAAVVAAGADYVVRLSAKALRLETAEGAPFNRAALCRQAEKDGVQAVAVRVRDSDGGAPPPARVIVLALPPDAAEAARRQMRKNARSWGYTPSAEALATAGCLMLITSLTAEDWPAERVLCLYRRRWQVELAFKRLKSQLDLEALRAFDSDLVSAWIHAVLIVARLIDLERPSVRPEAPDSPRWAVDIARSRSGASSPSSLAA